MVRKNREAEDEPGADREPGLGIRGQVDTGEASPPDPHQDRERQKHQPRACGAHVHAPERLQGRHAPEEEREAVALDLAIHEKEENPVDRRDEKGPVAQDRGERVDLEPEREEGRLSRGRLASVRRGDHLHQEDDRKDEDAGGPDSLAQLEVDVDRGDRERRGREKIVNRRKGEVPLGHAARGEIGQVDQQRDTEHRGAPAAAQRRLVGVRARVGSHAQRVKHWENSC